MKSILTLIYLLWLWQLLRKCYVTHFSGDKLNSDEVCDSPKSPYCPKVSFQASEMRETRLHFLLIWAQALFSLALYQCLLPADLQDFSQFLVFKVKFAWILFCSGISRHSWRPPVSAGHAGLMAEYSKPFHSYLGRGFCLPWLGCPSWYCCRWSEQLYSTSLAADKTRNENSQVGHVCMVALKMTYTPEEASSVFLVIFRPPKFSLLLFTDNFINRMVKTSHNLSHISCYNY